jgi:hypothetical protein
LEGKDFKGLTVGVRGLLGVGHVGCAFIARRIPRHSPRWIECLGAEVNISGAKVKAPREPTWPESIKLSGIQEPCSSLPR